MSSMSESESLIILQNNCLNQLDTRDAKDPFLPPELGRGLITILIVQHLTVGEIPSAHIITPLGCILLRASCLHSGTEPKEIFLCVLCPSLPPTPPPLQICSIQSKMIYPAQSKTQRFIEL